MSEEQNTAELVEGSEEQFARPADENLAAEVIAEDETEAGEETVEEVLTRFEGDPVSLIEALLFAHGDPVTKGRLASVTGLEEKEIADALESLMMRCELSESGVELVEVAGTFQLRTKAAYAPYIRQLRASKPKKLSQQALETLAIVAYRQPIVKGDIEQIRGVDATPTLKTLLERGMIRIVGHKETVGQPALYGTTDEFLHIFGLRSLAELPTLRDLKELEADPGESEETEEMLVESNSNVQ